MAEVEDYRRVSVLTKAEEAVAAPAVADMIHLLAELIENATMFSPSGTRVEVRAERVANGFAIEIDDRGLGIEPAQLDELNQQLADPPDFDLANADRLGLFVGAKLASRHGVRVALRPSPYGGTTAIVLMPNSIVSATTRVAGSLADTAEPLPGRHSALDLGSASGSVLAARRAAVVAAPVSPPASTADAPASVVPALASPGPGPGSLDGARAAGSPRLPQRTRQASLSPHLRDSAEPAAAEPADEQADDRSPEQARALASSLQTGWRRGRRDDPANAAFPPSPRQDPTAANGEEA
jgi:hypothetical protein